MKKIARRVGSLLLVSLIALSATACSNEPVNMNTKSGNEGAASAGDKVTIKIGGGPSSGANYTTFAGIGNLVMNDFPNYIVSSEISTGSQENIRLILNGSCQFGIAMSDVESAAFSGTREFEGEEKGKINHVMGGYTTMLHMMVVEKSDIQSIADLKGKKVAVSKGAMSQYYMPILLESYGLTMDDVSVTELALQDICNAISDGTADFGVHITPYTSSPIADLAATKGIRLISLEDDAINDITSEYPYFIKSTIPAGTYTGVDSDTVVIGTRNNLVCGADVDEDVVYNVVKTIMEHQEDLADIHPQAVNFNADNAINGALIDIHPGAAKYYKEIGLMQ